MRRSLSPSCFAPDKRQRASSSSCQDSPKALCGLDSASPSAEEDSDTRLLMPLPEPPRKSSAPPARSTSDLLSLIKGSGVPSKGGHQTPAWGSRPAQNPSPDDAKARLMEALLSATRREPAEKIAESCKEAVPLCHEGRRYFTVVWGKLSTKKHKTWEGDGVLIVEGRMAILRDMETGKEICRASGYEAKKLNALEDGSRLVVSGKECEIQAEMSPSEYEKCLPQASPLVDEIQTKTSIKKLATATRGFATPPTPYSVIPKDRVAKTKPPESAVRYTLVPCDPHKPSETPLKEGAKYYSVVWGKLSTKKHKTWQGDGVLVVQGRTVILRDADGGKEISRVSGYESKQFESLEDGSRLVIGGKECEIQAEMSPSEYERCFPSALSAQTPVAPPAIPTKKRCLGLGVKTSRGFVSPQTGNNSPLFPLHSIDALVMPRPSGVQQWSDNKENLPVTDVSVDPFLLHHLRPHQRQGVVFLYECVMGMRDTSFHGAILADEMGLGKTLQCITLIWTLVKQGPYGGRPVLKRTLVVTPSSLVKNWVHEFDKWLGVQRLRVFSVDRHHSVNDFLRNPLPVLVISYEMFLRTHEVLQAVSFDLLICDEAHRLKNAKIKTTEFLCGVCTSRRILLTGTPIQNDLREFYALADFCNPGVLGSQSSFQRDFEDAIVRSQQNDATEEEREQGEMRVAELAEIVARFVLRRTQDVVNQYLPGKVECVVFCRPSPVQCDMYRCLVSSSFIERCLSLNDPSSHLACISALRKLCNHPQLLLQHTCDQDANEDEFVRSMVASTFAGRRVADLETGSGKMAVLSKMLDALYAKQPRERIVLTLDLLERLCVQRNYSFLRLDGSTPTSTRQQLVNAFNQKDSKTFAFLLSCKSGGVGLNLVGASRIVLYDIDWNPANDLQAMSRVWRDGQTRDVRIYRLVTAGTIEEKMFQRQVAKQGLSGSVVDNRDATRFSREDLRDLFAFEEGATCTTHDLLDCRRCRGEDDTTSDDEDDDDPDARAFQLGIEDKDGADVLSKKNPGMAELAKWEHLLYPVDVTAIKDDVLLAAIDHITAIFRNSRMS